MEIKLLVDDAEPLRGLFESENIRIIGTVESPLFVARDVAERIGDLPNFRRIVGKYGAEDGLRETRPCLDAMGRPQSTIFLTETGLYIYLLQSEREEAKEFQKWVVRQLSAIRRQLIDAAQLKAKIAADTIRLLAKKEEIARACIYGLRSTLNAIRVAT